jgi:peptide deformylase
MTLRAIRLWPDPVLAQVCAPVEVIDDNIRVLAADMLETMYAAPGRGLAAPQIGVTLRIFVMDTGWKDGEPAPSVFINPEIIGFDGLEEAGDEGCLSIPGVTTSVVRPQRVTLSWTSLEGVVTEAEFDGFAARCVQHEFDHLNGVVTLDRLSDDARARAEAEYAA